MAAAGKSEIMADLGSPVPAMVVCKLLDAPMDDYQLVQAWVDAVSAPMKPVLEADLIEAADAATIEFNAYIKDLIASRRKNPGDDLLSRLIAAEEAGDRLLHHRAGQPAVHDHRRRQRDHRRADHDRHLPAALRNPDAAGEARREPGPDRGRGRRDPALRVAPAERLHALRAGGHRDRRRTDHRERAGDGPDRRRQPRPRGLPGPGPLRHQRPNLNETLAFGHGIHFCIGRAIGRQTGTVTLGSPLPPVPRDAPGRRTDLAQDPAVPPPRPPGRPRSSRLPAHRCRGRFAGRARSPTMRSTLLVPSIFGLDRRDRARLAADPRGPAVPSRHPHRGALNRGCRAPARASSSSRPGRVARRRERAGAQVGEPDDLALDVAPDQVVADRRVLPPAVRLRPRDQRLDRAAADSRDPASGPRQRDPLVGQRGARDRPTLAGPADPRASETQASVRKTSLNPRRR